MTRASVTTLLPLERFARLLSISPVHFAGAAGGSRFPLTGNCNQVWPQHSWQTDNLVSREEVAAAIASAELEVTKILGFPPAPTWVQEESQPFPQQKGSGYKRYDPSIKLRHGKVIAGGRRAATLLEASSAVTYSDPDGDSYNERATLSISTTHPASEIRVYFQGHDDNPSWEIRPAIKRSAASGTVTLEFDSWLFIKPALWEEYPTSAGLQVINAELNASYVANVSIYRVYNDSTQVSSVMYWTDQGRSCSFCGGTDCYACAARTEDGCFIIEDAPLGLVRPTPATYTAPNWNYNTGAILDGRPTSVRFWYYSGACSDEFQRGLVDDPMPHYIAEAITYMAAARLDKPFCSCNNVQNSINNLRRDMVFGDRNSFVSLPSDSDVYRNPFGTRMGEFMAWRRLASLIDDTVWISGVI